MTDHLTQQTIYAYLDHELSDTELSAMQAHVSQCGECAQRVELARALFAQLEGLPDEPLQADLVPGVIERLEPATRWLPRIALGEMLAALAISAGLLFGLGSGTVSARLIGAGRQTVQAIEIALQGLGTALAQALPSPGSLQLELGASTIWTVAAVAVALWALGNGLVLRRVDGGRRR